MRWLTRWIKRPPPPHYDEFGQCQCGCDYCAPLGCGHVGDNPDHPTHAR